MKILFVHAHFDDYEFTGAGTFEMWRRKLGDALRAKVVVCTDGKAGHHFRTRDETARVRMAEQQRSAAIGRYEFELLRYPGGEIPREACLQVTIPLLAALWKTIRDFEPDYLFCPPVPADAMGGVHVDHVAVAEAVRNVAYMINVPHAFTPEYPADETRSTPIKTPVILNTYDAYTFGTNSFDIAVEVEDAFEALCEMTWCHQSQIAEWLPWVGRHQMSVPRSADAWRQYLRERHLRQQAELGIRSQRVMEVFTVTAWGEVPDPDQLLEDLPNVSPSESHLQRLRSRLTRWRGAS